MTVRRTVFVVVILFVLGVSEIASQNRYCCYGLPSRPTEESLKALTAKAEVIFVGTVSGIVPAAPVYPTGEKVDWEAYDKVSNQFKATNEVTFNVEVVLKGQKVDALKTKGSDLVLLYDVKVGDKFLIFLHKEDKDGFRFSPADDVFPTQNVSSLDYHWDIIDARGEKGKRLPAEYGPYVNRFLMNNGLWMAGDTAIWTPSLKKDVTKELVAFDPQFADVEKTDEVFLMSTRGCHFTKDEWDRTGGVGYIGPRPCPLPLAFVEAYVKVLVKDSK